MPFFSQVLTSALMKFISGSSCLQLSDCPFPCQEEKMRNPLKAHIPCLGTNSFHPSAILNFSGTKIEIMLSQETNHFPFMVLTSLAAEISVPAPACLSDSTGAKSTSVLRQHGAVLPARMSITFPKASQIYLGPVACLQCCQHLVLEQRSRARSLGRQ